MFERFFGKKKLAEPKPEKKEIIVYEGGKALGSSGTTIFSGYFDEEYLQSLKGQDAAETYDKMRRGDSRVAMCLAAVKNPIKAATWQIQPAGEDEDQDKIAKHIQFMLFEDLGKPWKQLLSEILSCVEFGFSLFEKTHKAVIDHPVWGSYNGLASLGFRSQKSIYTWNLDKQTGKILSVEQRAYGDLERSVYIPGESLVRFTIAQEGDNYEGISMLRACYGPYYRKQVYLKLMAIGIERNAVPTPRVKYPEGAENEATHTALKRNLEALTSHQRNYIMYPEKYEIEFGSVEFSAKEVKEAIQFENEEMSHSFLQNFLLLGSGGNSGGSYSLSFDQSDFFLSAVEHIGSLICEVFNCEIIPELVRMNYGPQECYPKLTCTGITDKIGTEFASMLKTFKDGGFVTPTLEDEKNIRERVGLPELSEEEVEARDAAKEKMEEDLEGAPDGGDEGEDPEEEMPEEMPKEMKAAEKKSSFLLAEKKPKKLITISKDKLLPLMREELQSLGDRLVQDLMREYRKATPATRHNVTKNVSVVGQAAYVKTLTDWYGEIAGQALAQVRKEVPKAKNVKFSSWDSLPKDLQRKLKALADLTGKTQLADLVKSTFFAFISNVDNTSGSEEILEHEIQTAVDEFVDGANIETGATTAVSNVVNETRNAFFTDPDVLDEVESFTFVNGDPVSEICQDLAGRTFSKDDPEAQQYFPPLHYNCKSYISVNLKGSGKEIDPRGLKPSTAKIESTIQFGECDHRHKVDKK